MSGLLNYYALYPRYPPSKGSSHVDGANIHFRLAKRLFDVCRTAIRSHSIVFDIKRLVAHINPGREHRQCSHASFHPFPPSNPFYAILYKFMFVREDQPLFRLPVQTSSFGRSASRRSALGFLDALPLLEAGTYQLRSRQCHRSDKNTCARVIIRALYSTEIFLGDYGVQISSTGIDDVLGVQTINVTKSI